MKSKEEKIYTYIVLLIGILISYFYFYHLRGERWSIGNTYFSYYWRNELRLFSYEVMEGLFIFLQIFFIFSWWYIRDDLVKLIKIIHSKI